MSNLYPKEGNRHRSIPEEGSTASVSEAEQDYRLFFENAGDVIIHTDERGTILNVNNRLKSLFGYCPTTLVGKSYQDINIFPDQEKRRLTDYISSLATNSSEEVIELETIFNGEQPRFVEVNTQFLNAADKITGSISIIRDITSRKQQEELFLNNENQFQFLFENANDGIVFLDKTGVIQSSNKKIEELFGYSKEEIIGKPFTEIGFIGPQDMEKTLQLFMESFRGKLPPLLDYEGIYRDGRRFRIEINPTLIQEENEIAGLLAVIRDTTSRKVVENERERLIDIIGATSDLVFTYDLNGRILYANPSGKTISGLSAGDKIDQLFAGFPNKSIPFVSIGDIWESEAEILTKEGSVLQVSQVIMPHSSNGRSLCFSTIMRDISNQKQSEKHIKDLSHQLIKIQEDERLRISKELHDNLAQDLSSLKILFKTLFDSGHEIPAPLKEKITRMTNICQRSINSVRAMSYGLRPYTLDELGLEKTIYRYCKEFQTTSHIKVTFNTAGMKHVDIDFDTAINLYRIVQEALNNIKNHSDATSVRINLVSSYPTIILQIEDDGIGFDVKIRKKELISEKRMGLKSIEERVGLLGGTFRIQSKQNIGTRIHVEVPV